MAPKRRGGKRAGAGRKSLPPDQRTVDKEITFRPDILTKVQTWADNNGCNLSQAVNTLLAKALELQAADQVSTQ